MFISHYINVGDVDKIVEIKKIGMSNKEESCRMGIQPFRQLYRTLVNLSIQFFKVFLQIQPVL